VKLLIGGLISAGLTLARLASLYRAMPRAGVVLRPKDVHVPTTGTQETEVDLDL
jgi:hypothetical protein